MIYDSLLQLFRVRLRERGMLLIGMRLGDERKERRLRRC
jgi:hypothetical protein